MWGYAQAANERKRIKRRKEKKWLGNKKLQIKRPFALKNNDGDLQE